MSDKLIIHIGMEKTGTTTLQSFLTFNSSKLKHFKYWYPANPSLSYFQSSAHFPIAASISEGTIDFVPDSKKNLIHIATKDFIADAEKTKMTTIISCEHFSSRVNNFEKLNDFKKSLNSYFKDISIVVYLRNQVDTAMSSYSTGVLCGRRTHLEANSITIDDDYFNYLKILNLWKRVFEDVKVREYNRSKMINGDICQDFCSNYLNLLPTDKLNLVQDRNKSIGVLTLEVLRQFNLRVPTAEQNFQVWREAQAIRGYIVSRLSSSDDSKLSLSKQDKEIILSNFKEHNEVLNKEWFDNKLSDSWFSLSNDSIENSTRLYSSKAASTLKTIINTTKDLKAKINKLESQSKK